MSIRIKQGDAYAIPVIITLNGGQVNIDDVELVEFMLGDVRKLYPGDAEYDADTQQFRVPFTQEDTMSLPADDAAQFDVRVKFRSGSVVGTQKITMLVTVDAVSEQVI